VWLEPFARRQGVKGRGHILLELGGRCDVDHLAALDAYKVMVMLGQVLGELETGELVTTCDAPDDSRNLEIDEMPVCRAAGKRREAIRYVPDAHGTSRSHQQLDDRSPAGGVALVDAAQTRLDQAVQLIGNVIG
jgi:hypothetical protein